MAKKSRRMIHSLGSSMSFGMLSWKAKILWPMTVAEADDQGRFDARPRVMKWGVCQNVDEIATEDISELLAEMVEQGMVLLYGPERRYGQMLNWWEHQPMNYARPSEYPPPDGWTDRLRYHDGNEMVSVDWDSPGGFPDDMEMDAPIVPPNDTPNDGGQLNLTKPNLTKEPPTEATPQRRSPDPLLKHWAWEEWKDAYRGKDGKAPPPPREDKTRKDVVAFAEEHGREAWRWLLRFWKQHNYDPWGFDKMMDRGRKEFAREAHRRGHSGDDISDEEWNSIYASGS